MNTQRMHVWSSFVTSFPSLTAPSHRLQTVESQRAESVWRWWAGSTRCRGHKRGRRGLLFPPPRRDLPEVQQPNRGFFHLQHHREGWSKGAEEGERVEVWKLETKINKRSSNGLLRSRWGTWKRDRYGTEALRLFIYTELCPIRRWIRCAGGARAAADCPNNATGVTSKTQTVCLSLYLL